MITLNLDKIKAAKKKKRLSYYDLGLLVNAQPPTIYYFLKRAKQLKRDLTLIGRLCEELELDWHEVIK